MQTRWCDPVLDRVTEPFILQQLRYFYVHSAAALFHVSHFQSILRVVRSHKAINKRSLALIASRLICPACLSIISFTDACCTTLLSSNDHSLSDTTADQCTLVASSATGTYMTVWLLKLDLLMLVNDHPAVKCGTSPLLLLWTSQSFSQCSSQTNRTCSL